MVRGSPNPRYFGLPERLKKARKHARVSRTALAERVGGDQTTALDIDTGGRLPTGGTVARLANGLGVSVGCLAFALGEMGGSAKQAACDGMVARLHAVRIAHGLT